MTHLFTFLATLTLFTWMTTGSSQPASKENCISGLGCFRKEWTHIRTSLIKPRKVPASREELNVWFHLYTSKGDRVDMGPNDNISTWQDIFNRQRRTIFIIHGFLGLHGFQKRAAEKGVKTVLDILSCNVIVVNWTKASFPPYVEAVVNTQYVGAEVALRIRQLRQLAKTDKLHIHIIGVSLGAHVAGVAGGLLNGTVQRISGLDPAGPLFERAPPEFRLDHLDAQFVDVIHSDPGELGIKRPLGHMDFYPNYGKKQPGCNEHSTVMNDELFEVVARAYMCSHARAFEFFAERSDLRNCYFVGHKCATWEKFENGECSECGTQCARLGMAAEFDRTFLSTNETALFFLKTNPISPYCGFQYKVELLLDRSKLQPEGRFLLRLTGENETVTTTSDSRKGDLYIGGNHSSSFVIISRENLGMVKDGHFVWAQERDIAMPESKAEKNALHLHVHSVLITSMDSMEKQVTMKLCPEHLEPIPARDVALFSEKFCKPEE